MNTETSTHEPVDRDPQADIHPGIAEIAQRFSGTIGFVAKNVASGEELALNADLLLPAASAIKLPILVEVFAQIDAGELDAAARVEVDPGAIVGGMGVLRELDRGLRPTLRDLATLMIIINDNTATNMLIDLVGGVERVNVRMRELGLDSITLHNPIDLDIIYADPRRFSEATPRDLMRLAELVARDLLIKPSLSREVRDVLRRQHYHTHFPRYFSYNRFAADLKMRQDWEVGCMMGFMPGVRVDTGYVLAPPRSSFAFTVMVTDSADASIGPENEGAVVCGLIGKMVLEYWWSPLDSPPVTSSPYAES